MKQKGKVQPYWLSTSDNVLIKQLVTKHRQVIQPQLEALIQYSTVERPIDENVVFPFLEQDMDAFWSLLLFAGYLTVNDCVVGDDGLMYCQVSIPNQEIMTLYVRMIREWFT
ncbi:MAG: AAA-ATPase fused to superfamily nuclease [Gammaproteobacteria bacterium]|nr:AAA-ATPase fused to superfamily nuclease [Gammaproteobacteria bacterium]